MTAEVGGPRGCIGGSWMGPGRGRLLGPAADGHAGAGLAAASIMLKLTENKVMNSSFTNLTDKQLILEKNHLKPRFKRVKI